MRDRNWLIKSPVLHSRSSQGDSNCSLMTMSIRVITCSCHNGLFSVWTQWNLLLLVSHDDDVGQAATRASSPLSDSGTQGFSDMWLYQVTWIPADPLPSADNEHKTTVYKTDRKVVSGRPGGATHDWPCLWSDLNHSAREAQKCRTARTMCISEPRTACLPSGPRICAGNSIHLLQVEYSERRIK